ncbi:hypothetical protein DSL72_002031 [Monilinia vaccinii-corymbosi]|uniref:Uncharacterized protein n=1 Tax=Monilinia vaccinii-corymbosi TaxID=61207 RepID=A0A8A3PBJ3_9HELO|nr:hypothetical protein DSL72_002031 [Monilinia vaccinii-corymbosi]
MDLFMNEQSPQYPTANNTAHNVNTSSSSNPLTSSGKPHFDCNDTSTPVNYVKGHIPVTPIPSRPMRLSELLPLIHNLCPTEHAFEPLHMLASSPTGVNHFKLIDENVPFPERITLTKAFLKASIVHDVSPSQSIWSVTWGYTRYVDQWQTVKDNLLGASSGFIAELGSVFHLCAVVVMGEELLRCCKDRMYNLPRVPSLRKRNSNVCDMLKS